MHYKVIEQAFTQDELDQFVDYWENNTDSIYVTRGMNKIIHQNKGIMQIEIADDYKKEVFDYLNKLNFKWINTIRHDHYFIKDL